MAKKPQVTRRERDQLLDDALVDLSVEVDSSLALSRRNLRNILERLEYYGAELVDGKDWGLR